MVSHQEFQLLITSLRLGDDDRLERCGVQTGVVRGDTQIWPALPSEGPATVRCPLRAAIRYANAVRRGVAVTLRLAPGFYAVRAEPLPLVTRLLSGVVQAYSYDEDGFYGADGAPLEVQERRRRALPRRAETP